MYSSNMTVAGFDPELAAAIEREQRRQEEHIELIASENYASPRVLETQGSVLTNKYAEGYPGKRYYGGASLLTKPSDWRLSGPRPCSARPMPTFSPIPAPAPTWRCSWRWPTRVTLCWG